MTAAASVAANLALFILVVSLPAFREAHHHWIFPVLAALLAAEWGLTFAAPARIDRRALRSALLSTFAFLLVMGVVRHATILTCFDRCAFKLSAAAALAAPVFFLQARLDEKGFWGPARAGLAALGAGLWAAYLALKGAGAAPWGLDLGFAIAALVLWLGRSRAPFFVASLAVMAAIAVRATANESAIIGLGALETVLALALVPRVEAWRKSRPPEPPLVASFLRIAAAAAVLAGLGRFVAGPIALVTDPGKRQAYLLAYRPAFPIRDPKTLSPLAARLRAHVVMLAQTIGERDAGQRKKQERARDYVVARLRAAGYAPKVLPYESRWLAAVPDKTLFYNVEASLLVAPADAEKPWIVGAHYDGAPGTPGADDDASGVAVLLETARLSKGTRPKRAIRFVAFGTEEPPAFGTRNMGSHRYARALKETGVAPHGVLVLEMLGYYTARPGGQLYPPFLHLFFPSRGDFIGAVADLASRGLLAEFKAAWRASSAFPLAASILPGPLSSLALSDQLNFWDEGFPALMISDTAFYRNPNYHESEDLPDTLDYERMAQVTTALAKVLAEGGVTPRTTDAPASAQRER